MERGLTARHYLLSSLFLVLMGWGGLALMILVLEVPPYVWARWAFFTFWFIALSGTALPLTYFLNIRFPSNPTVEPHVIVRQSLWFGVYGSLLAWLQLGHVLAFWMWIGLAGCLITVEYMIRLRERSRWQPPGEPEETASDEELFMDEAGQSWLESDEPFE